MDKLSKIESSVFSINMADRNELLKWFAEAYYYNDELLEHGVYDEIYIRLMGNYKPITEDQQTLDLQEKINQGEKEASINNMSLIVLEQIMIGLKGGIGLDVKNGIDRKLFSYHNQFNKEFITDLYMEHLKDSVGKKVYVVGRFDKQPMLETGKLQDVDECKSIKINDQDIQFIGFKHYIMSIRDEDKNVLYFNNNNYDMSLLVEPEDINSLKVGQFSKTKVIDSRRAKQAKVNSK